MGGRNSKDPPRTQPSSQIQPNSNDDDDEKFWRAENLQNKHELGRGPNGYVVEALNTKTSEKCAIKIFEYNSRSDPVYQYAVEKARKSYKVNKLNNRNIVKTFVCEAIEVENNFSLKHKFAIIMELYDQNLADLIIGMKNSNRRFTEQQLLKYAFSLSHALTSAHRNAVYHGNIKEENIFVSHDGETLKLGDFDSPLAVGRRVVQKQAILQPPELVNQERIGEIDWAKVDCFALGIVLLKTALLRETLSCEEKCDLSEIIGKVSTYYSKRLEVIIKRLTAEEPSQRWSAERLFKSLQEDYMLNNLSDAEFEELLCEEQKQMQETIETGLSQRKAEDYLNALDSFLKAKNLTMRTPSMNQYDRTMLSNCLHNLALTYYDLKDYSNAITYHLLCLDLKKKFLGGMDVFNSYGNIGKAYNRLGSHHTALIYYTKAYTAAKKSKGDSRLSNMARSLDNIGAAYENLGDYDNALENHFLCLELIGKQYGETNSRYAKTLRNISRNLKNLGRFEEARVFEMKAKRLNY